MLRTMVDILNCKALTSKLVHEDIPLESALYVTVANRNMPARLVLGRGVGAYVGLFRALGRGVREAGLF